MPEGVILKSASFDQAGDAGRQENLEETLENNGLELKEEDSAEDGAAEPVPLTLNPPPRKSRRERAIEKATAPLLEKIKQLEAGQPPVATRVSEDPQAAQARHFQAIQQNYKAQVDDVKSRYDDWDQTVNQDLHIGIGSQLALLEQENGAECVYYLGKHPDYAARLGKMTDHAAAAEIGRLSERLKAGASRPRFRTPPPVRTVSTAGSSAPLTPAEVAARPNYAGKARDFRKALAEQR